MKKSCRIINTADDYGISLPSSLSILQFATRFRVDLISVTPCGPALQESAELWHKHTPRAGLSLHFTLSDLKPVVLSGSSAIVDSFSGRFLDKVAVLNALSIPGLVSTNEIVEELHAQWETLSMLFNTYPSHISTHQHLHMHPRLHAILISFANKNNVQLRPPAVYVPGLPLISRSLTVFPELLCDVSSGTPLILPGVIGERLCKSHLQLVEIVWHPFELDSTLEVVFSHRIKTYRKFICRSGFNVAASLHSSALDCSRLLLDGERTQQAN